MFELGNRIATGRPLGSKNLITEKVRENFNLLLESNLNKMQDDLNQLTPKDRLNFIIELSSYILPKLRAIEVTEIKESNFQPINVILQSNGNI
jgi:hypothetical protein